MSNEPVSVVIKEFAERQKHLRKVGDKLSKKVEAVLQKNGWSKEEYWMCLPIDDTGHLDQLLHMVENKATPEGKARQNDPFIRSIEEDLSDPKVEVTKVSVEDYTDGYSKAWVKMVSAGRAYRVWTPDCMVHNGHSICFYRNGMAHFFRGMAKHPMPKSLIETMEARCGELVKKSSPGIDKTRSQNVPGKKKR
jgi:hypothetical protein